MTSMTVFILFVGIIAILFLVVNLLLAPHNSYQEKQSAFECGYHSFFQTREPFNVSFYLYAMLFLLFDLELLLVYPYATSSNNNGSYGLAVILLFLFIVTIGFTFELGKGALTMYSKQNIRKQQISETIISSVKVFKTVISPHKKLRLQSDTTILIFICFNTVAGMLISVNSYCFRKTTKWEPYHLIAFWISLIIHLVIFLSLNYYMDSKDLWDLKKKLSSEESILMIHLFLTYIFFFFTSMSAEIFVKNPRKLSKLRNSFSFLLRCLSTNKICLGYISLIGGFNLYGNLIMFGLSAGFLWLAADFLGQAPEFLWQVACRLLKTLGRCLFPVVRLDSGDGWDGWGLPSSATESVCNQQKSIEQDDKPGPSSRENKSKHDPISSYVRKTSNHLASSPWDHFASRPAEIIKSKKIEGAVTFSFLSIGYTQTWTNDLPNKLNTINNEDSLKQILSYRSELVLNKASLPQAGLHDIDPNLISSRRQGYDTLIFACDTRINEVVSTLSTTDLDKGNGKSVHTTDSLTDAIKRENNPTVINYLISILDQKEKSILEILKNNDYNYVVNPSLNKDLLESELNRTRIQIDTCREHISRDVCRRIDHGIPSYKQVSIVIPHIDRKLIGQSEVLKTLYKYQEDFKDLDWEAKRIEEILKSRLGPSSLIPCNLNNNVPPIQNPNDGSWERFKNAMLNHLATPTLMDKLDQVNKDKLRLAKAGSQFKWNTVWEKQALDRGIVSNENNQQVVALSSDQMKRIGILGKNCDWNKFSSNNKI